jgi:hypothetical protein
VDSVPASIEVPIDAIASAIESLGQSDFAFRAGDIGAFIETIVDAIAARIQPFIDSSTSQVEPLIDSFPPDIEALVDPVASDLQPAIDAIAEPIEKSIRRHHGDRTADCQYGESDHYAFSHCANTPVIQISALCRSWTRAYRGWFTWPAVFCGRTYYIIWKPFGFWQLDRFRSDR